MTLLLPGMALSDMTEQLTGRTPERRMIVHRCPWILDQVTQESCGRRISANKRLCLAHQQELDAAKTAHLERELQRQRDLLAAKQAQ